MKNIFFFLAVSLWTSLGWCQGTFVFYNPGAPTRIGSPAGPIAGSGIWGQALVGTNASNLIAVGFAREHTSFGIVPPQTIQVPFIAPDTLAQVQMAAWDGSLWGTDFASVPLDQLGFTDIVPVWLFDPLHPAPDHPLFTQPAIVPIPEPSAIALTVVAALVLTRRTRIRFSS